MPLSTEEQISKCVDFLERRLLTRKPCFLGDLLDETFGKDLSYKSAYEIQRRLAGRMSTVLGPQVGYKIGATTPGMQKHLGVTTAMPGAMHESRMLTNSVAPDGTIEPLVLNRKDFNGPSVECEITMRLGKDLDARRGKQVGLQDVFDAVSEFYASAELVDDRYGGDTAGEANWQRDGMQPIMVADNFFHWACLRSPLVTPPSELSVEKLGNLTGYIALNGEVVKSGTTKLVLQGNPLESVQYLASFLAEERNELLPAGTWIMAGSVTMPVLPKAGDKLRIWFDGLNGAVEVHY